MTSPDDVEYRLDAEHIRGICLATAPAATVNVTHTDHPPTVFVHVDDPHRAATALRQVGYDTDLTAGALRVHGWSEHGLRARITSLIATLERLDHGLPGVAERAVDAYATRFPHDYPPDSVETARDDTLTAVRDLQRREIDTITGPHALHDPHIRPDDPHTADLVDQTHRLEHRIGRELDLAQTVATYAIDAYTLLRIQDGAGPPAARRAAITRALGQISRDIRRQYAEHRANAADTTDSEAPRLAATAFPQAPQHTDPSASGAPPASGPSPSRPPHRAAS